MTRATQQIESRELRRRARQENFSVASILVGASRRRHLLAIYDYARLVDQLGDAAAGDRDALLDEAERELARAFEGTATQPVFRLLQPAIAAHRLPYEPFLRLVRANRLDQVQHDYGTFEQLLAYCELSANPVGELVLHVFGAATPERVRLSNAVCTALQLVEHWQDVAEDAARGRIYVPREDRERFSVAPDDLRGRSAGESLRRLLAFESQRASSLLDSGRPLIRSLPGVARLAVAGYVGGGRATLAALAGADYDVLATTPRASRGARAAATVGELWGAR